MAQQRRQRSKKTKRPVDNRALMKSAQSKVFPVVLRIKEEIDFCFTSFYGDMLYDSKVCERAFAKWVARGHRGPGELTIYIEMLAAHLAVPTQQSIFRNLAYDCISVIKKNKKSTANRGFFSQYKFQILVNLGILVLFLVLFYSGKMFS